MVTVINFGGQYSHLIARRIRDLGVKSILINPETSYDEIIKQNPKAIIFSGSPYSIYEKVAPKVDRRIYSLKIPILGVCYGMQLLAYQFGGRVSPYSLKQFGKEKVAVKKSDLFAGLSTHQLAWFSHGDQVEKLPRDFRGIASTKSAKIVAFENPAKKIYAVQFHIEVSHTANGQKILENFLFKIAKAKKDWNLKIVKDELIKKIKNSIKKEKVVMAVSGGVDSLVAATLLKEAIDNLYLVFIDTGLLRLYDISDFKNVVQRIGLKNTKIVKADEKFFKALRGVIDPEEKRQKIAKLYFSILEEEAKKIGNVKFLGQGTIYPDRIESAQPTKHADRIKSHHNITLPYGLKLKIIEPLGELYKDEVRQLGELLKLPKEFLMRHPFPGPGLAIRIIGEVTKERVKILQKVDDIFISELKKNGMYKKVGQSLAALLPVKAVGVMGDVRTYSYIVALRSVDTVDFMTADWSKIPHLLLERISSRIVNEVRNVNRVVYDITQKPPSTIEYE